MFQHYSSNDVIILQDDCFSLDIPIRPYYRFGYEEQYLIKAYSERHLNAAPNVARHYREHQVRLGSDYRWYSGNDYRDSGIIRKEQFLMLYPAVCNYLKRLQ